MFERFTPKAIKAVMLAQYESSRFGLDNIGTEALLLGLIAEEQGVAARAMEASGLDYVVLLQAVAAALGKSLPLDSSPDEGGASGKTGAVADGAELSTTGAGQVGDHAFTAQAQVALEDACELAQAADAFVVAGTQPRNALVGAAGVDTEHILLALLKSENCPAAKALANLDVDKVKLKSLVLNLSANAS